MASNKWRLALTAAVLGISGLAALSVDIRWLEKDYDFGLMREEAGPKTGRSRFINVGSDTIMIFSVRPSCGCTSAEFDEAPLAPGDTASISYTYDPKMRPGKFNKSVKVRFTDTSQQTIRITGNVLGTPESLSTIYPVDAGAMRLSDSSLVAPDVRLGQSPMLFLNAYCLSPDSISPALVSSSKALVVSASEPKVGPGDIQTFSLNFNSRRFGKYGAVEIPLEFTANPADASSTPIQLTFKAFVLPDTQDLLLKQGGKNPVCVLQPDPLEIGAEITAPVIRTEFTVSNRGNGPLHILQVESKYDGVTLGKLPKEIKPGKSAKIKLDIDVAALPQGAFRFPLYVITDDPDHPHLSISITGSKAAN